MSVNKQRAWETLQKLSFERVTGTKQELEAANMILEECKKADVDAIIESYEIETPTITKASFAITKPEYKEIHCIGVGKCENTPDEGIEAPFKYIDNGLETAYYDIRGKIVLVTGRLAPDAMKKLKEAGCVGVIQVHGTLYDQGEIVNELRPRNARGEDCLPSVVIHIKDAQKLVMSQPEMVKIVVQGDANAKSTSQNVVATIPGCDERLSHEILAFSAHYDSVPYSPGAWDNMTGCINLLELMHHFKENPTKRTLKFIWCGSEEIGGRGSSAYCEKHQDELKDYIYDINFDMTGVTLGYEHFCCSASEETFHYTQYLAKKLGYSMDAKIGMYPSDSSEFALQGVPSCSFCRLACNGGKVFHNRHDNMDFMDPDSFMITLNFVVEYASEIANAPMNVIKREFAPSLEKELNEWKERAKKDKK